MPDCMNGWGRQCNSTLNTRIVGRIFRLSVHYSYEEILVVCVPSN